MKVLMYGWEFPPNISGGLGVACYGIVHSLLENQIEVALILPGSSQPASLFPDVTALQIIQTPFLYPNMNPYIGHKLHSESNLSSDIIPQFYNHDLLSAVEHYAISAGAFAKETSHDVIHAHDWLTILAGIAAKRISNKPLIFHVHSLEISRSAEPINKVIFDIEKYGLEQADLIISVSEFTKQRMIRYYKISADKIVVVHNGLFKEQMPKQVKYPITIPKYKTVLFLGRITHQKGPFHFIEAAHKILRHRKDVQFVIAGDGDLFHSAIERVAELRLGAHIHFTLFLDREKVEHIFKKCQVYVMPSVAEPFGLTCLESLAQHVPVILSKQSGVSEVIQHTLKVDFWDIDEMASKICALLDYPALQQQLLENSAPELHQLLWTKTAKNISNVYQRLTGT
jgi:glycosyltransferase involved in cell wall biosynthesis